MTPERWYVLWWLAWTAGALAAGGLLLWLVVTRPIVRSIERHY